MNKNVYNCIVYFVWEDGGEYRVEYREYGRGRTRKQKDSVCVYYVEATNGE